MTRQVFCCGSLAILFLLAPGSAAAHSDVRDTTRLTVTIGPAFEVHRDALASRFRQKGAGVGVGVGMRRGGVSVGAAFDAAGTSSQIAGPEDTWTLSLDVGYTKQIFGDEGTSYRVGAELSGLAFVRRHYYGRRPTNEFYADLMLPVSAVGEIIRPLGANTSLEERLSIGMLAELFRSAFSSTKEMPTDGRLVGPGSLRLARNRLTVARSLSPRVRLSLTHLLVFYDTDTTGQARVIQQQVDAGLTLLFGGGGR